MPLGVTSPLPLVKEEAKLLLSWLAIVVEAAVAILEVLLVTIFGQL